MGLFKRAHVRGMMFELIRRDLLSFPSEKIADEVADAVADNLPDMPEEGMEEEAELGEGDIPIPEMTGDEGLTAEEATAVVDQLVDVAEQIAEKTGNVKDAEFNKLAASVSYEDAAILHANAVMEKAALEEGTDVTGDGRFQDVMAEGQGPIDAAQNPSSEVVVPQGTTSLDTSAGAVGAEVPQEETPGASAITPGEVAKLSSLLKKLSETDNGTAPGSGDTGSDAYQEAPTNVAMSGVAPSQGTTTQPKGPVIGEQKPQPAQQAISPATPNEVSKLSSVLSQALEVLQKQGGELPPELKEAIEDKKDDKKDDDKKDDKREETGPKGEFSRDAAVASLNAAAGRASGCKKAGGPTGRGRVSVTFASSGRATTAVVGPPFAGTKVGSCAAAAFRGASVPPFSSGAVTVSKSFYIR